MGLFLVVMLSLSFSLSYDLVQTISDDGSSVVMLTVDYTDHFNSLNFSREVYISQLNDSCKNKCTVNGLRATYERNFHNGNFYEYVEKEDFLVQTTRQVKLTHLPRIYPVLSQNYGLTSSFLNDLKNKELNFKYTIVMPDDVSYAPGATIKNKKAIFNALESDEIIVEIYEYDILRIVLLISIIIFVYFILNGLIGYMGASMEDKPNLSDVGNESQVR